jgi:tRNA dimethylallyltransferase
VIIIITGPTAIGKTNLSLVLFQKISKKFGDTFILSVDSRQVYRYLDIGTDKVSKEIRKTIPHYLIDSFTLNYEFSLYDFLNITKKIIDFIKKNNLNLIMVGGTILYIYSLVNDFDLPPTNYDIRKKYENYDLPTLKEILNKIDKNILLYYPNLDKRRIIRYIEIFELTNKSILQIINEQKSKKFSNFIDAIFILNNDRNIIYENINNRVDRQIKDGLIDEVKFILKKYPKDRKALKTFGYMEIIEYLENKVSLEQAIDNIKKNTRHFAKRQLTFLKKLDSNSNPFKIHKLYIKNLNYDQISDIIIKTANNYNNLT